MLRDDIFRTLERIESKQPLLCFLGLWLRQVLGIAHQVIGFRAENPCAQSHYIVKIESMIIKKKLHNFFLFFFQPKISLLVFFEPPDFSFRMRDTL